MRIKEDQQNQDTGRFGENDLPEWEQIGSFKVSNSEMYRYGYQENPSIWVKIKKQFTKILDTCQKNGGENDK